MWLDCRFHIIRLCLHSMFLTVKMALCWVVLYWQNQNSMATPYQPFWMVWVDSCFWSVGKTISSPCRMHIVKVLFADSVMQPLITSTMKDMYVIVVDCLFVCLSVCLLATLRKKFQKDLHEIFREGWQWASEQMIKFWWWFGNGLFSGFCR